MGYTTEFSGRFELNKPLTPDLYDYLDKFSRARHFTYDLDKIVRLDSDWRKSCYCNVLGPDGMFYAPAESNDFPPIRRSEHKDIIKDYNRPPENVPGLWCQWIPSDDGRGIEWDGEEKFHNYVEWLKFLIQYFLAPNGYVLHGDVEFQGEDFADRGWIIVDKNRVKVRYTDEIDPRN